MCNTDAITGNQLTDLHSTVALTPSHQTAAKRKNIVYTATIMYGWTVVLTYYIVNKNQLHAVSRTQQGRQREPSVETLRYPLSAEFWRHCVLSDRTQRRALPRHQSEEMEIYI